MTSSRKWGTCVISIVVVPCIMGRQPVAICLAADQVVLQRSCTFSLHSMHRLSSCVRPSSPSVDLSLWETPFSDTPFSCGGAVADMPADGPLQLE